MESKKNVVCFDWDDTLLNTTDILALMKRDNKRVEELTLTPEMMAYQNKLDDLCVNLITQTSKNSEVIIITNAELAWFNQSSVVLLPKTKKVLSDLKINIYSAQDEYKKVSNNYTEWKYLMMKKVLGNMRKTNILRFVSIGDSDCEKNATLHIKSDNDIDIMAEKFLIRTVKMKNDPNIKQLIKQLQLIDKIIVHIIISEIIDVSIFTHDF